MRAAKFVADQRTEITHVRRSSEWAKGTTTSHCIDMSMPSGFIQTYVTIDDYPRVNIFARITFRSRGKFYEVPTAKALKAWNAEKDPDAFAKIAWDMYCVWFNAGCER